MIAVAALCLVVLVAVVFLLLYFWTARSKEE